MLTFFKESSFYLIRQSQEETVQSYWKYPLKIHAKYNLSQNKCTLLYMHYTLKQTQIFNFLVFDICPCTEKNTNTSSVRYKLFFSLLFFSLLSLFLKNTTNNIRFNVSHHTVEQPWRQHNKIMYSQNYFIKRSLSFPTMWDLKQNLFHCNIKYIKLNVYLFLVPKVSHIQAFIK